MFGKRLRPDGLFVHIPKHFLGTFLSEQHVFGELTVPFPLKSRDTPKLSPTKIANDFFAESQISGNLVICVIPNTTDCFTQTNQHW